VKKSIYHDDFIIIVKVSCEKKPLFGDYNVDIFFHWCAGEISRLGDHSTYGLHMYPYEEPKPEPVDNEDWRKRKLRITTAEVRVISKFFCSTGENGYRIYQIFQT